jgi:hypothetical protein
MSTRTDIRDFYAALYAGLDGIDTVYRGRRRHIPENALPAVCVYVESEEKGPGQIGGSDMMERRLSVVSEIHVNGTNLQTVEETLDTLCAAREAALFADETLGGLVLDTAPQSDEYTINDEGRRPGGVAVCTDVAHFVA